MVEVKVNDKTESVQVKFNGKSVDILQETTIAIVALLEDLSSTTDDPNIGTVILEMSRSVLKDRSKSKQPEETKINHFSDPFESLFKRR